MVDMLEDEFHDGARFAAISVFDKDAFPNPPLVFMESANVAVEW